MNVFLKIAAYLFHPLWMSTFGVLLYYSVTPRFMPEEIMYGKLAIVFILTFLIPVIFFFILKNMNVVQSINLETVQERKVPLMLQLGLFLLLTQIVFDIYNYPELYYYFMAMLISVFTAFTLSLFRFKVSLHTMGIAALTMFAIALSIHFSINILMTIAFLFFACGWVASSRLHTKSHTAAELIIGFFIGWLPQLILVGYWL